MPGPTLGRYRLSERLAAPATQTERSELWRGVDVGLGGLERPVAVELCSPSLTSDRALAADVGRAFLVGHQNLVAVRDAGELDGRLFVAWEWVDGVTLQALLERLGRASRPLPLRFGCLVTVETARGLEQAERARNTTSQPLQSSGLVHGDVAPERIWLSPQGEVKLAGLGLGRARPLDGGRRWLAPEQARGEAIDGRADVFALGATLYELASGHNPFGRPPSSGDERERLERLERLRAGVCPSLRSLQPALPQALEAIVLRAMAPARDDRYPSCAQLREDLEAFARREGYLLSQSDFALFVGELLAAPAADATAAVTAPAKRLSGSRAVAAPRAFNAALGGALAALDGGGADGGGDDGGDREARSASNAIVASSPPPRTVAMPQLHAAIAATRPAEAASAAPEPRSAPASSSSDSTELIPRDGGLGALSISAGAAALMILGGVALAILRPFRSLDTARPVAASSAPASIAPSGPAAPVAPSGPPAPVGHPPAAPKATTAAPAEREHRPRPAVRAAEAHLTITTDVAADAFIDGSYVRPTPIVDLELPPGRHVVRVESTAPGLRLIPRQQTIELQPGERKELQMVLQ